MRNSSESHAGSRQDFRKRRREARRVRNVARNLAQDEFTIDLPETNEDEQRFAELGLPGFASFTKALKHNENNGLVIDSSFQSLLDALDEGTQEAFESVILGGATVTPPTNCSEVAARRLVNPLNSYSFQLIGNCLLYTSPSPRD